MTRKLYRRVQQYAVRTHLLVRTQLFHFSFQTDSLVDGDVNPRFLRPDAELGDFSGNRERRTPKKSAAPIVQPEIGAPGSRGQAGPAGPAVS